MALSEREQRIHRLEEQAEKGGLVGERATRQLEDLIDDEQIDLDKEEPM
jgi:hypothetical protein